MFYYFKVSYWVDDSETAEDRGFVPGNNYEEAIHRVVDLFNERDIDQITLKAVSNFDVLYCQDEECAKAIIEENNV